MNENFKRFAFYNLFFLCALCGMFMVLNLRSFASNRLFATTGYNRTPGYSYNIYARAIYGDIGSARYCFYLKQSGDYYDIKLLTNTRCYFTHESTVYWMSADDDLTNTTNQSGSFNTERYGSVYAWPDSDGNYFWGRSNFSDGDVPTFYDLNDAIEYLNTGVIPQLPFDETLKLDSFKVTSWQIGTSQLVFRSKFEVTWSDDRITNVQVRIVGTANSPDTFENNSSPFKQKFYADNYVMKNGDIIHLTATPYKSNGEYGESLYYSIVYNDGLPSNWYRKLVNTPYNDNTLTIPYYNVSDQPQTINVPIDGTTQNICYKVNYNPTTNEITNENVYNVYYSPVVVIPEGTTDENESEIINYITNEYNTNNYYNIVNNISYNDVSYGDVSEGDIKESYKETKDYFKLFKKFVKLLANIVGFIFPFLSGGVVLAITVGVGFITALIIVMFAVKLIGKILDWIF